MTLQKILITGSSGYVGNFLAVYFGTKGIPVVGLDLTPHPVVNTIPNFSFEIADCRNAEALKTLFQKHSPTYVIHLAYLMDPTHDLKLEYDVDVQGSKNAFEAANAVETVRQFILFSSTSIYGANPDNPDWLNEDSSLRPGAYRYAQYKKELEDWLQQVQKRSSLKIVILRMCTAVGPSYYKKGGVVASLHNGPFGLQVGKKINAVQFIHEDDVKAIVEKVMSDESVEGIFNLCPDSFATIEDLGHSEHKNVFRIPLWLLKLVFFLGWHLRLMRMYPAMADLIAYSIVATPKKLMNRYQYRFQYSTLEAYLDAVKKRLEKKTL